MRVGRMIAIGVLGVLAGVVVAAEEPAKAEGGLGATVTYAEFRCKLEKDATGAVTAQDCKIKKEREVTGAVKMPAKIRIGSLRRSGVGPPTVPELIAVGEIKSIEIEGLTFEPSVGAVLGIRVSAARGAKVIKKNGDEVSGRIGSFNLTVTDDEGEEIQIHVTCRTVTDKNRKSGKLLRKIVFEGESAEDTPSSE